MRSKRLVTTGGHYAFLKIAEGCDKRCTYCIIPYLRGPYRSVPMEQLLAEAKELADQGVKELILVAQETTLYGMDLYGEKTLPKLLHELAQIDGIRLDPYPVLLSGGDHRGVDPGDQDGGKSLSLPGYSDPARERCRFSSGWDAAPTRRSFGSGSRICGKRSRILHSVRP